tara:strand:+ start:541 stop:1380 length:840 start_codon:yes stop_codon:yes gene_type:complete
MIDYIVACYVGRRRNSSADPLSYIKNHLNWLESAIGVGNALFVFNDSPSNIKKQNEAKKLIEEKGYNHLTKPNFNMSYGAWEYGIYNLVKTSKSNYAFLIEDDYVPSNRDSLNYFLNEVNHKTGFVASFYQTSNVGGNLRYRFNHAAIANGLVSYEAVKKLLNNKVPIFCLSPSDEEYNSWIDEFEDGHNRLIKKIYGSIAVYDQRHFLHNIEKEGYEMKDVTENNFTLFYSSDPNSEGIHVYGNDKGVCLIQPNFDFNNKRRWGAKNYQTKKYGRKAL